ncbi:hypothetical protein KC19_1G062600 [Ceratodon purpureus]|uniref:Uncharacterized protein n=1 Tax=Ceratodon purpureus TaxID=3225 RepID=A0A8T0J365_CERPU|nr:hypothetical protein KC19_1G062600 [Ceratodon purpureus]
MHPLRGTVSLLSSLITFTSNLFSLQLSFYLLQTDQHEVLSHSQIYKLHFSSQELYGGRDHVLGSSEFDGGEELLFVLSISWFSVARFLLC